MSDSEVTDSFKGANADANQTDRTRGRTSGRSTNYSRSNRRSQVMNNRATGSTSDQPHWPQNSVLDRNLAGQINQEINQSQPHRPQNNAPNREENQGQQTTGLGGDDTPASRDTEDAPEDFYFGNDLSPDMQSDFHTRMSKLSRYSNEKDFYLDGRIMEYLKDPENLIGKFEQNVERIIYVIDILLILFKNEKRNNEFIDVFLVNNYNDIYEFAVVCKDLYDILDTICLALEDGQGKISMYDLLKPNSDANGNNIYSQYDLHFIAKILVLEAQARQGAEGENGQEMDASTSLTDITIMSGNSHEEDLAKKKGLAKKEGDYSPEEQTFLTNEYKKSLKKNLNNANTAKMQYKGFKKKLERGMFEEKIRKIKKYRKYTRDFISLRSRLNVFANNEEYKRFNRFLDSPLNYLSSGDLTDLQKTQHDAYVKKVEELIKQKVRNQKKGSEVSDRSGFEITEEEIFKILDTFNSNSTENDFYDLYLLKYNQRSLIYRARNKSKIRGGSSNPDFGRNTNFSRNIRNFRRRTDKFLSLIERNDIAKNDYQRLSIIEDKYSIFLLFQNIKGVLLSYQEIQKMCVDLEDKELEQRWERFKVKTKLICNLLTTELKQNIYYLSSKQISKTTRAANFLGELTDKKVFIVVVIGLMSIALNVYQALSTNFF